MSLQFSGRAPLIALRGVTKIYFTGRPNELEILHGIDLTVWPGEFVAIVGESGSGKSTIMNIIGALDRPTSGSYLLDGVDIERTSDRQLSAIRNREIGFVFQTFNLIGRTHAQKKCRTAAAVCRRLRSAAHSPGKGAARDGRDERPGKAPAK